MRSRLGQQQLPVLLTRPPACAASDCEWKIATRLSLCKCLLAAAAVIVARILHNHDTLQMIRRFQHARVIINVTPH